jgi:hypothetical protein
MADLSAFTNSQSGVDHYTNPLHQILRIETALSNTAARLYDAAEKHLDPSRKPKDKVTEQLLHVVGVANKLHEQAVEVWNKTDFKNLNIIDRLKIGTGLVQTTKTALSQAEGNIERIPEHYGTQRSEALEVITAQQTRLNDLLKEHYEREQIEIARNPGKPQLGIVSSTAEQLSAAPSDSGTSARPAEIESGTYRGTIVSITDSAVLQQISSRMLVLHQKQLLDSAPQIGQNSSIRYSNGTAVVKALHQPVRGNELAR